MTEQEFAVLEARMRERLSLSDQLTTCLAEIRELQKRRCRLEAQLRQMYREACERRRHIEEVHAA